jgi:hypothetical protein
LLKKIQKKDFKILIIHFCKLILLRNLKLNQFVNSLKTITTMAATTKTATTNDWLATIQSSLESAFAYFKAQSQLEKAPEAVKEMVEAYEELAKSWFESLRAVAQAKSVTELNDFVSSNTKKFQASAINAPAKWVSFYSTVATSKNVPAGSVKELFEIWKPVYSIK